MSLQPLISGGGGNIKNNDGNTAKIRCFQKTVTFTDGNASIPISSFDGVTSIDCAFGEILDANYTTVCRTQVSGTNIAIRALSLLNPTTPFADTNVKVHILLVYQ